MVANEENLQPQILILLIKIKENLSIIFQKLEKASKISPRESKRDQIINLKSEGNELKKGRKKESGTNKEQVN